MELFSALDTVGPTFFLATAMFGFVFQMTSLITEKELKLRQVMDLKQLYVNASDSVQLNGFKYYCSVVLLHYQLVILFYFVLANRQ